MVGQALEYIRTGDSQGIFNIRFLNLFYLNFYILFFQRYCKTQLAFHGIRRYECKVIQ
jgi:hypothetical protein